MVEKKIGFDLTDKTILT